MSRRHVGAAFFMIVAWMALLAVTVIRQDHEIAAMRKDPHAGEASWSIQGLYSHPNCDNQPGTRPYYLEMDDGSWIFLECMR